MRSANFQGVTETAILGVDIGGTGMKAAIVASDTGRVQTDRFRIPTPDPGHPIAMAGGFEQLVEHFDWTGPIGSTFPGVIHHRSIVDTAANLDQSWVGVNASELFGGSNAQHVVMINDADAAGLAEIRVGAGRDIGGVVFMLTIGTGLGTAIFNNGVLVPNTELGHIEIDGVDAEMRASGRARKAENLTIDVWAKRVEQYLNRIEALLSPDRIIIGGGISKRFETFGPLIQTRAELVPAALRNHAGIVGAAMAAATSW